MRWSSRGGNMNKQQKMILSTVAALALVISNSDVAIAQQAPGGPRGPSEFDAFYTLGPDSLPRDGVPKGEVRGPFKLPSKAYPGVELSLIHISEPTRQAEISYAVFCL